jgi:hypothetical protein
MKDKKLERALYGPSLMEVTLGAALSVGLGLVAGIGYLLYKPVETVKALPKEADRVPGQIYYVEGSKETGKAKQWRTKRKQLADSTPGEIALIEDELNAWFAPDAPAKPAPKPATPVKAGEPAAPVEEPLPDELVTWSNPNFRITDNAVQVSCSATFNPLRMLALDVPLVVQANGGFEKEGDEFVYAPKTFYVGSLPMHRIPGMTSYLIKRAKESQAMPEQGIEAWKKVSDVTVDGRVLKLAIR